jgi:hypothetical protein
MPQKSEMKIAAEIVAELKPLIIAQDDAVTAIDAAEARKAALLEGGSVIISGGTPISNNAEFNSLVSQIQDLDRQHERAIAKLALAVTQNRDFVLDLFNPILATNENQSEEIALRYELGHATAAHSRVSGASNVWPLRKLIASVSHNGANGYDAACQIVLHLSEFIAGTATGANITAESNAA